MVVGGDHNTVGGCVIHSSTKTGVSLTGGRSNRFVGNDVYDVAQHASSGDCSTSGKTSTCIESNAQSLVATNNLIANNHFTQAVRRDFYGGIKLRGIGDRLSRNLAHDASGQYLTPNGPLTMVDANGTELLPSCRHTLCSCSCICCALADSLCFWCIVQRFLTQVTRKVMVGCSTTGWRLGAGTV